MDPHQQTVTQPTEAEQPRHPAQQRGDSSWKVYTDQWNENHGTFLMIFAAGILLTGLGILTFQQTRFRKPAFPSPETIARLSGRQQAGVFDDTDVEDGEFIDGPTFRMRIIGASADDASGGGGLIRIAVYSSSEQFNQPELAIWKKSIAIPPTGNPECKIPIDQLPSSFAVAAFQDVSGNGQLDRNVVGVPTERYGFSNDARGTIGPPSYDQALVERPEANGELELHIR